MCNSEAEDLNVYFLCNFVKVFLQGIIIILIMILETRVKI